MRSNAKMGSTFLVKRRIKANPILSQLAKTLNVFKIRRFSFLGLFLKESVIFFNNSLVWLLEHLGYTYDARFCMYSGISLTTSFFLLLHTEKVSHNLGDTLDCFHSLLPLLTAFCRVKSECAFPFPLSSNRLQMITIHFTFYIKL